MGFHKPLALAWLLLALLAAAFVGTRFIQSNPVETDILALLPATERNHNAEAAVKALSNRLGNRLVFLVGHADAAIAKDAARSFAETLRRSAALTNVAATVPRFDPHSITELYRPYRAGLISREDQARVSQTEFNADALLLRQLYQPMQTGLPVPIAEDPFGFWQRWLSGLPLMNSQMRVEDDMLVFADQDVSYVLVVAEPSGSAFDTKVQEELAAAVNQAESGLQSYRDIHLLRTGTPFYAQAARETMQAEIGLIGGGSLLGILLMLWLTFRSAQPLALGVMTVAIGIIAGMAATLFMYEKLHIITLVFGASLIGEAIDYSVQYFAAHVDGGADWNPDAGIKRILPGLGIALATSLFGYLALSLTPFPAISQIALFSLAGLTAAWVSAVVLLPLLLRRPSTRNMENTLRLPRRVLAAWRCHMSPARTMLLCAVLIAVSAPGWFLLNANDDIRELVSRPQHLVEQENAIRGLAASDNSSRFFLVEGGDAEEALLREEALVLRLQDLVGKDITGYAAVSEFVPSAAKQQANRNMLARSLPAERVATLLEHHGFREQSAEIWRASMREPTRLLDLDTWYASPPATPMRHHVLQLNQEGTALIVTLQGDKGSGEFAQIADELAGVTFVDKTGSVTALFAQYRNLASFWLPLAALIVAAILMLRYGWRRGITTLVPPVVATLVALGIYGYLGMSLTLFTMMGLVLMLGVGVNYSIFLVEAGDRAPAPFVGVILSAATTLLSFGLLSLSSMPALHQFGLILLIGVSLAVLLAPVALTMRRDT